MIKLLLGLSLGFLLLGCATQAVVTQVKPPLPSLKTSLFTPLPVPALRDVFAVSKAQKEAFLSYYNSPKNQLIPPNVRLFEYLEDYVDGFNFHGVTLTASEALEQKTGNCLTLAIVTKALADLVGLETAFQRVNSAPVYARYADVMTLSSHVRTYVYEPNVVENPELIVVRRASVIIDYFPTSSDVSGYMVAQQDFIAMYYQNLAAEALITKQYDYAYSLLKQGIVLNHSNPDTLNTLAVLFTKLAEHTQAETLYLYMLDNDYATANVIANYSSLLQTQGRIKEAKIYAQRIDKIEDDNPYRWIDMADKAFNTGDYALAERYYKKANQLAPYVHESQFGLAKAYYQLGKFNSAKAALNHAIEISYRADNKQLYQAKLQTLLGETSH